MPAPIANSYGNAVVLCTSTVSGARFSGAGPNTETTYRIDVALGKPMLESIAQIAAAYDIKMGAILDANYQLNVKLTDGGSTTYNLDETWYQQGLREGDTVVLETV